MPLAVQALKSKAKVPEQSLVGSGVPAAFCSGVRRRGVCTHSVPPFHGTALSPFVP